MDTFRQITSHMPQELRGQMEQLPDSVIRHVEEIRLRCGQKALLTCNTRELQLNCIISAQDLQMILHNLIQFSYYAYEEDLAKGFVTIEGGHRVGICGRAVIKENRPALLREISSLNIRFAREIKGCSNRILPHIFVGGKVLNTLIVSPPGCGKTTLLRDMARCLSEKGVRTAICDERSELAGMFHCCPSFDLGPRCDVLDGCEKSWGIPMLIRSMSPQVIITDEIGKQEDVSAAMQCLVSGVSLIASIHGTCPEDLAQSAISSLVNSGFFQRLVYLCSDEGPGTIKMISCQQTGSTEEEKNHA